MIGFMEGLFSSKPESLGPLKGPAEESENTVDSSTETNVGFWSMLYQMIVAPSTQEAAKTPELQDQLTNAVEQTLPVEQQIASVDTALWDSLPISDALFTKNVGQRTAGEYDSQDAIVSMMSTVESDAEVSESHLTSAVKEPSEALNQRPDFVGFPKQPRELTSGAEIKGQRSNELTVEVGNVMLAEEKAEKDRIDFPQVKSTALDSPENRKAVSIKGGLTDGFPLESDNTEVLGSAAQAIYQAKNVEVTESLRVMAKKFSVAMPVAKQLPTDFNAEDPTSIPESDSPETSESTRPIPAVVNKAVPSTSVEVDENVMNQSTAKPEQQIQEGNQATSAHEAQGNVASKTVAFEIQPVQLQSKSDLVLPIRGEGKTEILQQQIPDDFARNLIIRISDELKLHIEGKSSEVRVVMKPESMGRLSLHIVMENGKLAATMDVSQPAVKSALEAQLPQLREALASLGIDIQRFDIVGRGDTQFPHSKEGNASQHRPPRPRRDLTDVDVAEKYDNIKYLGYNTVEYII